MYSMKSRVRYSETDEHSNLTPEGVLDYFQDCSCFESEDLGMGIDYMEEKKLAWVLSSWQIIINQYPRMGNEITTQTMPYQLKGFYGLRNYRMLSEDDDVLAYANAMWSLISTDDYRPQKPSLEMLERYELGDKLDMDYAPRKIDIPEGGGGRREEISVKAGHLDSNRHVNNGKYIRIAFESLNKDDTVTEDNVKQIRAQYTKAAMLGDIIYPRVINGENVVVISLEDAKGSPYAIVELKGKE